MRRPISRWATLAPAFVISGFPGTAIAQAVSQPGDGWTLFDSGAGTAGFGLRNRPFRVTRLIDQPRARKGAAERVTALGPAPADGRPVSFTRRGTDAPSASLQLRYGPRFSRQPGKQLQDFEAGLRSTLADGAIDLQAGVAYNKFRNLQTSLRDGDRMVTATAGKAKTYGVETMARWSADDRLSLFVAGAYREGRLKNHVRDGRKFRLSADRTATVGAVLLLPIGARGIAFIPSLAYGSAMGLSGGDGGAGARALVNAQLGYAFSDGFEVEALASNLLNGRYARPINSSVGTQIAGEPRVFGMRARLRFGMDR